MKIEDNSICLRCIHAVGYDDCNCGNATECAEGSDNYGTSDGCYKFEDAESIEEYWKDFHLGRDD